MAVAVTVAIAPPWIDCTLRHCLSELFSKFRGMELQLAVRGPRTPPNKFRDSWCNLLFGEFGLPCPFADLQICSHSKKKNELLLKFNIILKLLLYYALKKLDHPLILLIRRLYQPQNPDW